MRRISGGRRIALLLAGWMVLVVASAFVLLSVQRNSREEIQSRFNLRVQLTADFIQNYSDDFLDQERKAAERALSQGHVSAKSFDLVVNSFDSEAAVLLDSDGRALQVYPRAPDVVGTNLAVKYAHLSSAVAGKPAVSNVVPSAAKGIPIVAFATPFDSAAGNRVFSAAFDIRSTPLSSYLKRAAAVRPNGAYLVDQSGAIVATNDADSQESAELPEDLREFSTKTTLGSHTDSKMFVVSEPVDGTPWRLVMTSPESFLFATVDGSTRWVPWVVWFGFATGGLLSIWLVSRLINRREALAALNEKLDRQANIDPLTELANRRRVQNEIEREIARARRNEDHLSVLLVDVDSFKSINDTFGHRTGDEVLKSVAAVLRDVLRDTDGYGRWGGDEFLVVLPHIDIAGAAAAAGRLNERIRSTPVVHNAGVVGVTASIGCAQWYGEDADALVHRADGALYEAKAAGRDGYAVAEHVEPAV